MFWKMGQYLCRRVAGDSGATRPGSSIAAGRLLPGSDPESGTSSDILLKPNVASWVSGEARYGSEVAIMKRAPPPQTGGGDRMKPSTTVTVHRGQRGAVWEWHHGKEQWCDAGCIRSAPTYCSVTAVHCVARSPRWPPFY